MAKLIYRTIEVEVDSADVAEVSRGVLASIFGVQANGRANGHLEDGGTLKLPGRIDEPPKRRLGRPPKATPPGSGMEPFQPKPTGDRLGDKIETLMMQAGRGVQTVYLAQRLPGVDLKNIKMALGQGCRHRRFNYDEADETYSLADVR